MANGEQYFAVRGLTDGTDQLIEADDPLAQLQLRCGGELPGTVAVPALFEMVRHARLKSLRLAREFQAFDGNENVSGFVRISPIGADEGCELMIENWRQDERVDEDEQSLSDRLDQIDRMVADLTATLDAELRVLTVDTQASDLSQCIQTVANSPRSLWSDFIELVDEEYRQPLHWRLIDGMRARVAGSDRDWRIRLMPLGLPSEVPYGFELLLVSEQPWIAEDETVQSVMDDKSLVGEMLTRVLRQPISRIISNSETIRTRLAGPLRKEYTDYASDIASAGSHLLALLDDLADLEAVEADGFATASDEVDLVDAAARAAGILSVKSSAKSITVKTPDAKPAVIAKGEFRRVLQILINLIGNAINYSPEGSAIEVTVAGGKHVSVSVTDQGPGLSEEQQLRVFTKFERLGREGDGGSGLGLYISRRFAEAMDGMLSVESEAGKGASFTLALPQSKKS
ncbi:MAG: ATP-binding protein [Erythrobacter sp.]